MHLEKLTSTKFRLTLHTYELATVISALRWIVDGTEGTLSREIIEQMKNILENYDRASGMFINADRK